MEKIWQGLPSQQSPMCSKRTERQPLSEGGVRCARSQITWLASKAPAPDFQINTHLLKDEPRRNFEEGLRCGTLGEKALFGVLENFTSVQCTDEGIPGQKCCLSPRRFTGRSPGIVRVTHRLSGSSRCKNTAKVRPLRGVTARLPPARCGRTPAVLLGQALHSRHISPSASRHSARGQGRAGIAVAGTGVQQPARAGLGPEPELAGHGAGLRHGASPGSCGGPGSSLLSSLRQ
ncbi:uncharacterized protein LOC107207069 [Parus major]|uniref:uncharacterized protein LOC107207069 n=1 Tax=Parus major TaxID=9157 RepID=UPI0007713CB5|nr:uncharacterized protein LOC107207069 [Parus major]